MQLTESGYAVEAQRGRFAALANRHEEGTAPRAVSSFNIFQTPETIAERMAGIVADHCGNAPRVLEPSAGLGRIYNAIISAIPESRVVMVEESKDCASELYRIARDGDRLLQRDFLELSSDEAGEFNAIVMNPPFKQGRDIKHILHAFDMLTIGGILVSLCYDGARQNAFLKPLAYSWETLPTNSFRESGTSASVVMLTMKK